jgi:hypothetical protein
MPNRIQQRFCTDLAKVGTSVKYEDLTDAPTFPAAQINADGDAKDGVAQILQNTQTPLKTNGRLSPTKVA